MNNAVFLFPGQASQYVGMGKDLYDRFDIAKTLYDRANEVLGFDLRAVSFEGPEEALKQTRVTQPAIFVHSVIVNEIVRDRFELAAAAGHSLGEYSALVAAGAMDFEAALNVVKVRAELMQQAGEQNPGAMAAVIGMEADVLGKICCEAYETGVVQCANYNSPGQIVISGSVDGVRKAMEMALQQGARMAKELVVSGAFHSPLMESAKSGVQEALASTDIRDAVVPVYANVTGKPVTDGSEIRNLLVEQITSPVKWHESMVQMISDGLENFYEVGAGAVLQGLMKRIDRQAGCSGIGTVEDIDRMA